MKKLLPVIFLIILPAFLYSQEILLDKDVEEQYKAKTGPNMRHYGHFYSALGMVTDFDEESGTSIDWWRSGQYMLGYRYKLKLLSFYAIGLDLSYRRTAYFFEGINQNPFDPLNPLTLNTQRDRHRLINSGLGLEFYHRINFGRRGNTLGKYLDTGIRAQWNVADVESILVIDDNPDIPAQRTRIKNRRLTYIMPYSYGLTARIGFNKIIFHANYRLSDYFREEISEVEGVNIPETPRLALGIQFAI